MKRNERLFRKARYGILAAIMAGAFSIMPAAQAMPTGGASETATITTTGSTMDIASSVTNNLLTWQDFSIAKGETVNFGGSNTYLNVVTGNNASEIYGAITGSAANVYLINPNGILFGDGAQVNVGSLHLSTADISGKLTDFDTALDALNGADSFSGDIVNKGTLTAAQEITVDGNNITFKNTADVSAASVKLKLTAAGSGEIHIGSADGATPDYTMNGTKYMYKLVSTAEDLRNINSGLSGNYMLAGDITLTAPDNTETGSNFTPIGGTHWNVDAEKFTGRFDGLNYTINNLYIYMNPTDSGVSAGLFAAIGRSGVVENLTLGTGKSTLITNRNGYNGSFAGLNDGILRNVVNNGVEVTGSNFSSGGIVGYNCRLIDGATNKAAVTTKVSYSLGGIVGENDGQGERTGIIRNSLNTGAVTNADSSKVGGIVGNNLQGTLQNVSNSGTVTGSQNVGGIAGLNNNEISNAANTGTVQGGEWVGGVIGYNNQGTLTNAYNIGSISISYPTGAAEIGGAGGVVGANEGIVTNVYNEGTVSGWNINGGVVGLNGSDTNGYGVLRNAYNTGTVRGTGANTGGIVGLLVEDAPSYTANGRAYTTGSVENVYNTGEVTSTNPQSSLGAIVGQQKGGTISGAYYLCNLTTGVGGETGGSRSTTQVDNEVAMKQATTFAGFSIDKDGSNSSAVWRIYEGKTMPLLTAFLTPLTLADTTVVYDGQAHSVASLSKVDSSKILGGTLSSYTNSGTYTYTGLKELYSDQQGYNIKTSGDTAMLTINKAPLTINFEPIQKQYDGTTNAVAGQGTLKGVLGKDNVSYAADVTAVYDSKNVGSRTVNYSGIKLTGADAGNYSIEAAAEGKGTITAAPLTITFADTNKQYDGTTNAVAGQGTLNGVLGNDQVSYEATAVYDSKNAGSRTVNYSGITLTGADAGNYSIEAAAEGKGTITAAPLTITFADTNKQYDGTTNAVAGQGTLNGVLGEDNVSYAADVTAVYDSKNVGSRTVNYSGITLTGADAGNYSIEAAAVGKGTITAAPLTITFADINKQYDGTTNAVAGQGTLKGVLGEDNVSYAADVTAVYDSKNAGSRTVNYSGITLTGADAGNYSLEAAAEGKGTITAAPLTINFAETDKQYDGTTNAVAGQGTLKGVLGEDNVSYAADVTAVYDSKNAGSRTVNYSGITLTGADAGNYSIEAAAEGKGTITAAPLTLLVADITKEYDSTTEAPNASYSITNGQLFGEDTLTGGSFAYEDKSVGTGKTVTLTGVNVSDGNEGQNYTLTIVNSTNSAITANAPTAVVSVMADRLEAAGTSLPKMEEVIAVAAPAPAATVPTPAAIEPAAPAPAVQSEDEQQSDNVETAATTATTHGDDHANAPAREKPVHNALGKDGVLTMVNEGVNPPESMSAETVAQQNKNTNGNNKEGE